MTKATLAINGMHCASCAGTIEKVVGKMPGVASCQVNFGTEKATIEFDPQQVSPQQMSAKIEPFGYTLAVPTATAVHGGAHGASAVPGQSQPATVTMIPAGEHVMPDGSVMTADEHAEHTGIGQTKEQKLKDLADHRSKVQFTLPITFLVFALMMWETLAITYSWIPRFFLPMDVYQKLLLLIATVFMFWAGKPFLKGVANFVQYRVANMDSLIGIGTLAAYLYSGTIVLFPVVRQSLGLPDTVYFDVTIVVIGFILLGKFLEARSKIRTGEAIEKLVNLQAKTAIVERDGTEMEVPVDQVQINDVVLVKPGAKIPVDGQIVEGRSSIDESMITGEPIPVDKKMDDTVIGGTINKQGSFKFRALKVGSETMLAHIIKMVEEAQGSRAPIQKLADKISSVFVPIVLVLAALTFVGWLAAGTYFYGSDTAVSLALLSFVSILVIACPCALGLATPTAIIVGVGKGASNGMLIKNAESLEKLHSVKTIVVDKTGTITKGKPEVTDIISLSGQSQEELLSIIASLEKKSEHPLAEALVQAATTRNVQLRDVSDFEIVEGKGLRGTIWSQEYFVGSSKFAQEQGALVDAGQLGYLAEQGKTPVILGTQGRALGIFAVADTIKESAPETVKKLHKLGIKVVMLTGDDRRTATYIAKQVGIDEVFAEVLPGQKADKVKELQARGIKVAMAGDGINDAPALAQSDVGVAMGTGTDVAIESADITLLNGDIAKLPQAIKLSKRTLRTIKQNLFWAFIYNIIGIPIAAGILFPLWGIMLNPVFAGLAMAFSSVSVVTNSLRLKAMRL